MGMSVIRLRLFIRRTLTVVDPNSHAVHSAPEGPPCDRKAIVTVYVEPSLDNPAQQNRRSYVCAGKLPTSQRG